MATYDLLDAPISFSKLTDLGIDPTSLKCVVNDGEYDGIVGAFPEDMVLMVACGRYKPKADCGVIKYSEGMKLAIKRPIKFELLDGDNVIAEWNGDQ